MKAALSAVIVMWAVAGIGATPAEIAKAQKSVADLSTSVATLRKSSTELTTALQTAQRDYRTADDIFKKLKLSLRQLKKHMKKSQVVFLGLGLEKGRQNHARL